MPTFSMPLYIDIPRKTKKDRREYINLNPYRNWQHHLNNQIKIAYKEIAGKQIKGMVFNPPIELEFVLWKNQNRIIDRANALCIHEKFFCDALSEFKCIPDDNDNYILSTKYRTGGIDKDNPRVDIIITEIQPPIKQLQLL